MKLVKVLLIEDDKTALKELSETLRKESFEVVNSVNGEEAIKVFNKEKPDIIITDLKLPGLTGFEIMEKIRVREPDIPIILITAYGQVETALKAIQLGALDYIKKPIDLNELLIALGRAKERVLKNKNIKDFPIILFAEDDDVARTNLVEVLKKEGWNIIGVENGLKAYTTFQQRKVDIVLLDIKMPVMDGITALNKMRKISDDFEAIILTGYGDESNAIDALRNGALNFIKKPIDLEELIIQVEKAKQKLTSDRAYQYRIRELEIAHQIIAQLSRNAEISISLSEKAFSQLKDNSSKILDLLSDSIFLIDVENNLYFANKSAKEKIKSNPVAFNESIINKISKIKKTKIDYSIFENVCKKMLKKNIGNVEKIQYKSKDIITITSMKLKIDKDSNNFLLVIIP